MNFGFCVPVFANPGSGFCRPPAATVLEPQAAVDAAGEADVLGMPKLATLDRQAG